MGRKFRQTLFSHSTNTNQEAISPFGAKNSREPANVLYSIHEENNFHILSDRETIIL